jgi:hypothetical protein
LKSEPPSVDSAEVGASDFVPVGLCVRGAWNCQVLGLSAHWPSSFGDPNGLASNCSLGCSQRSIEQALTIVDAVGHCVLEIWVCIHSDEVAGVNDRVDATFGPAEAESVL